LWISLSNTEALELTNNAYLTRFVLNDYIAWTSILLSSCSTLYNCTTFGLSSIWNPSFDDDVTYKRDLNKCMKDERNCYVRGRGGRGGKRSMMTDRGGTGKAAKRRITVWEATEAGTCGGRSRRTSGGG
jgi:hypothetical protein